MHEAIRDFVKHLIVYDYILFGILFFLFLLFIVLGILFRQKFALALFFILFAFAEFIIGATYGYTKMHAYLFKNEITITEQKRLSFTDALVIYASVKNTSTRDFQTCKITASVYKKSANKYKEYILEFKPIQKMSMIENDIRQEEERAIKMIVEPFVYRGDYNVALEAKCR